MNVEEVKSPQSDARQEGARPRQPTAKTKAVCGRRDVKSKEAALQNR